MTSKRTSKRPRFSGNKEVVVEIFSHKRFKSSYNSFYDNATLSDVTLQIDRGEKINGHKIILSKKSGFFRKAFTGRFKEAEESHMNLIDDETPRAVTAMLRHIYDLPYEVFPNGSLSARTLLFYVQVFVIADKYDVPILLTKVAQDFKELAEEEWDGEDFLDAITKLYQYESMADQTFHDCIKTVCKGNLSVLLGRPKFVTMLKATSALTAYLLQDIMELRDGSLAPGDYRVTKCSYYHYLFRRHGMIGPNWIPCTRCKAVGYYADSSLMLHIATPYLEPQENQP